MRSTSLLLLAFLCTSAAAQLNLGLVGQLDYHALRSSDLSNLWGYTDELGNEYALVGVNGTGASNPGGISVVSLADPSNPQEIFFYPGPTSIWREIKVWNDHAYVTTEANSGGLTIVDLSPLPQSFDLPAAVWQAPDWYTSHSLFIDENGRLYLHGANRGNGGVIMYDLTQDPFVPVEVGSFDQYYCHDSFARGDTLYAAHIYDGFFSILDVSDPASPVLLGTRETPNQFTHNTWLDDSGRFLFTTDERSNSYVGAYDVSDPQDIEEVDRLRSDNGSGAIPHNTYWKDDYVITSYYTYGVSIYDATYPHNMVEVGNYDTSPFSGDGFHGAWGVYPFFDSGRLIISDIEQGLVVLEPQYIRACWLEGVVSDAQTAFPVGGATVTILGPSATDVSVLDGSYATGYHLAGSYSVQVTAPGYLPSVINNVVLENGVLTTLNVALEPAVAFSFQGMVVVQGTSDPVPNAQVMIHSPNYDYTTTTDVDGLFAIGSVFSDSYEITAGAWGWRTTCLQAQSLAPGGAPLVVELEPGYRDEFALDLGWQVSGTATDGTWERGAPVGTSISGTPSNPGQDVQTDCADKAFVTGNGGGGAGDDDVDGGYTTLTSPVFDATAMVDPFVRYHRWFYNGGGSGSTNDALTISLSNGSTTAVLETITSADPGMSSWLFRNIRINDHLTPTATMRFIATAVDNAPGHVVEGAIDVFEVVEGLTTSIRQEAQPTFSVVPNPNNGQFRVVFQTGVDATIEVVDAVGRMVARQRMTGPMSILSLNTAPGVHVVKLTTASGTVAFQRLIITE